MLNSFCWECTGGDAKEIKTCDDVYCPFYRHRRQNMDWQDRKIAKEKAEAAKKALEDKS